MTAHTAGDLVKVDLVGGDVGICSMKHDPGNCHSTTGTQQLSQYMEERDLEIAVAPTKT